jgi:replicative DNA helicase
MATTLEHALFYAKNGWKVFPLKPRDKVPAVKWADVATTEENMIQGWWEFQPDANVGIACGECSGITVLDVDKDHGGYDSLSELLGKYGRLPDTPVAKTGSGGEHIFFKYVPGTRNSAGKLGKGLDIRSQGGYVVGASSKHPNGNIYEWVVKPSQVELSEMPEWMIELLKENRPEPKESGGTSQEVIEGGRNDYLTKMAGAMRRKSFSEDAIFAALQIHNREKCSPPLSDGEVYQIAHSINRYEPQDEPKAEVPLPSANSVIEILENEIRERQRNPKDIWGIPYAWDYLSKITGGKQKGELIILAGEPGVGKSWLAHQDALYTAVGRMYDTGRGFARHEETPVLLWSGEMRKKQVFRRFFEMLGVPKRSMMSGKMSSDDWEKFEEAKAIVMNSPIYVSDTALDIRDLRPMLERAIDDHGIQQVVFDYDWLINAPGSGEIEQSQNISRAMKQAAHDLNLSIVLISSVNKMGMDSPNENVTKSNVSGSGKKLHDADIIYILTKFNEKKNSDLSIMPTDYQRIATLHISKARELDYNVPGGAINYMRETPNPKFRELIPQARKL